MKKRIISIDINYGLESYYIDELLARILKKQSGYICFSNVHMLIEAHEDVEFAAVVNKATYAFPDGFPIAKSFNYLYNIQQPRIAGMDFLPKFLNVCNEHKFKAAFIGSTEDVLNLLARKLKSELPNVEITALISPPFNQKWDNQAYIQIINNSNTDVVFVALGCPKQEKWMFNNYNATKATFFGIGGALPTYVGVVSRAPLWMQNMGMEWFYRFIQEPKRMWRRYLIGNTKFILLVLKEKYFKTK